MVSESVELRNQWEWEQFYSRATPIMVGMARQTAVNILNEDDSE